MERGGAIYYGYQTNLGVFNNARLNFQAGTALLTQLGMPLEDPSVPLALTAGSYQGSATCQDAISLATNACTLTFSDTATGAFTGTNGAGTFAGTLNFLTGGARGTYNNPISAPTTGNFVAFRR